MSTTDQTFENRPRRGLTLLTLAFAIAFPSGLTWVYFVLLQTWPASIQQAAYGMLKTVQFALPALWTAYFFKGRLGSLVPLSGARFAHPDLVGPAESTAPLSVSIKWSIGFGMLVVAGVFGGYLLLDTAGWIDDQLTDKICEKVSGMNLDTPLKFAALGIFYTFVHSFLEEYYWRWFVYVRLRDWVSMPLANVVSSLGFMSHHVILLATFFGWGSPLTWVLSGFVAFGGAVWAWLYQRNGLLIVPWISHLMVDAAIFGLGYVLIFGAAGG